jgi:hypothetical protein
VRGRCNQRYVLATDVIRYARLDVQQKKELKLEGGSYVQSQKKKAPRSSAEFSTLDDFLKEQGKLEEFEAIAVKEVLDWQIAKGNRPAKNRSLKLSRPPTRSD